MSTTTAGAASPTTPSNWMGGPQAMEAGPDVGLYNLRERSLPTPETQNLSLFLS